MTTRALGPSSSLAASATSSLAATAGSLTATAGSLAATAVAGAVLRRRPPGGAHRWRRTNHRGEPVSLLEGPALVVGAATGLLAGPGVPAGVRAGGVVAVVAAGSLGAYDDLAGDRGRKGLAGHLGALARGEVTTGAVKLLGLAATGAVAAGLAVSREQPGGGRLGRAADVLVGGAVVAGAANLVNLLDLRPGRALKVGLGVAPLLLGSAGSRGAAAVAAGAAVASLPGDLRERTMLGDCGANALGALLGVAADGRLGRRGRLATLATLATLTLASERVSFTTVIEGTPVLRELDRLGRRPPARAAAAHGAAARGATSQETGAHWTSAQGTGAQGTAAAGAHNPEGQGPGAARLGPAAP